MAYINKFTLVFFVLLASCASNEERWQGSVEDFTSRYVDELRRLGSSSQEVKSPSVKNKFSIINTLFVETALAKTKSKKPLILKTKEVRRIQKSQAKRMMKIDKFKVKKSIGEMDSGIVGVRSLKGLSKKEKKEVQSLVEAENEDREKLYKIISKASGYTKKMEVVLRKSFFDSYQEWSPSGTYYFTNHKWQKKQ